jgi:hypothetical protein
MLPSKQWLTLRQENQREKRHTPIRARPLNPGKSQGRPNEKPGPKPIAKNGLPVCVLPKKAPVPDHWTVGPDPDRPSEKHFHAARCEQTSSTLPRPAFVSARVRGASAVVVAPFVRKQPPTASSPASRSWLLREERHSAGTDAGLLLLLTSESHGHLFSLRPAEQESAAWPRGLLVVVRVRSADVGFYGAARGTSRRGSASSNVQSASPRSGTSGLSRANSQGPCPARLATLSMTAGVAAVLGHDEDPPPTETPPIALFLQHADRSFDTPPHLNDPTPYCSVRSTVDFR